MDLPYTYNNSNKKIIIKKFFLANLEKKVSFSSLSPFPLPPSPLPFLCKLFIPLRPALPFFIFYFLSPRAGKREREKEKKRRKREKEGERRNEEIRGERERREREEKERKRDFRASVERKKKNRGLAVSVAFSFFLVRELACFFGVHYFVFGCFWGCFFWVFAAAGGGGGGLDCVVRDRRDKRGERVESQKKKKRCEKKNKEGGKGQVSCLKFPLCPSQPTPPFFSIIIKKIFK